MVTVRRAHHTLIVPNNTRLAFWPVMVLAQSAQVTRMSLAVFATEAAVSQPTAIRFVLSRDRYDT